MTPLDDFDQTVALAATGNRPHARRRLSDKILAAFSHAYAVGETDVAARLKDALQASESHHACTDEARRGYDPLGEADMWVAFVEARDRYRALSADRLADRVTVDAALDMMKDAYRRWSMS